MKLWKELLSCVAIVCLLSTCAFASEFSTAGPSGLHTFGGPESTGEYTLDDGASENSVGLAQTGGDIVWMNRFDVAAGAETINGVSFTIGTPVFGGTGAVIGSTATVHVWDDTGNDGNPNTTTLLASTSGTITNADDDVFMKFSVPDTDVGAAGDSFFLGVQLSHGVDLFPASVDESSGDATQAFIYGDTAGVVDPSDLGSAPIFVDLFGVIGSQPGTWMIRGNAVPEPSALGLLGIAGLGLLGWRRRR